MKAIEFKENTAYHAETEDEANWLLKKAHEQGYRWPNGGSFLRTNKFDEYGSDTCYSVLNGLYDDLGWYESINYSVVKVKELMKEIEPKTERTEEQKDKLLENLWNKRRPAHDNTFWKTVRLIIEDYTEALNKPNTVIEFLVVGAYPGMSHSVDDVISVESDNCKGNGGTTYDADFFRSFPHLFKEIK